MRSASSRVVRVATDLLLRIALVTALITIARQPSSR
jgi:hypothetical protein